METWATDIENSYLEENALEKFYIIAGTEFCDMDGHIIIFAKALYVIQYSGLWCHEMFVDCLIDMEFFV